jgi:UDP-N-acetylmuramyl tripeptide synthase
VNIIVSRSYFGPNQHLEGSGAYLHIEFSPEERETSAEKIAQALRDFSAVLCAANQFPSNVAATDAQHSGIMVGDLSALLVAAVRAIMGSIGEESSVIVNVDGIASHEVELILRGIDAEVGKRAGVLAAQYLTELLAPGDKACGAQQDFYLALEMLTEFAAVRRPSLSEAAILAVAEERQIPAIRFGSWPFQAPNAAPGTDRPTLLQLGQGVHGQSLMGTAIAAETARSLSSRAISHAALGHAKIPVPDRDPEFTNINSLSRALRSAKRIGYPVALKPVTGPRGLGVSVDVANDETLLAAYSRASAQDRRVIIERHIPGDTYRILIIGNQVAGVCRQPGPKTGQAEETSSTTNPLQLHSTIRATALRAAACFRLSVAGVDIVTPDPSLPLEAAGGAVIRVDPAPNLGLHLRRGEDLPLNVARRLLAHLFPADRPARIPIVAITGTVGKTTSARMVSRILEVAGFRVGLACTDGVYVGRELIRHGTFSGIAGALTVFSDRRVDVAVLETSRGTLVRKGLGFDYANVGVCTTVEADHIGLEGIESVSQMARLKRVVIERTTDLAVVNAENPHCLGMLADTIATRTALVAMDPTCPAIIPHIAAGGVAALLDASEDEASIVLWESSQKTTLMSVSDIPAAWRGMARHNVQNALFAAAICIGLDVSPAAIREGLRSFHSSTSDSPKRINRYDKLPFEVILDQAGSAPGYRALCEFIDKLPVQGRRVLVFYGLGDRRDEDLAEIGQRITRSFDNFICFEAANYRRGRQEGEIIQLLTRAMLAEGVEQQAIRISGDAFEAVQQALEWAGVGDLVVLAVPGSSEKIIEWLDEHRAKLSEDLGNTN